MTSLFQPTPGHGPDALKNLGGAPALYMCVCVYVRVCVCVCVCVCVDLRPSYKIDSRLPTV